MLCAGSLRALARALGVSHQAIAQWRHVPAERVVDVERATSVPRHILRPDLYMPGGHTRTTSKLTEKHKLVHAMRRAIRALDQAKQELRNAIGEMLIDD
jgi:DNA-binding transcriptional regulator YdaS (Cro superfamily)